MLWMFCKLKTRSRDGGIPIHCTKTWTTTSIKSGLQKYVVHLKVVKLQKYKFNYTFQIISDTFWKKSQFWNFFEHFQNWALNFFSKKLRNCLKRVKKCLGKKHFFGGKITRGCQLWAPLGVNSGHFQISPMVHLMGHIV